MILSRILLKLRPSIYSKIIVPRHNTRFQLFFPTRNSFYSTSVKCRCSGLSLKLAIRNPIVPQDTIMLGELSYVSFSGLRQPQQ